MLVFVCKYSKPGLGRAILHLANIAFRSYFEPEGGGGGGGGELLVGMLNR